MVLTIYGVIAGCLLEQAEKGKFIVRVPMLRLRMMGFLTVELLLYSLLGRACQ
jgi:hypothetical protein